MKKVHVDKKKSDINLNHLILNKSTDRQRVSKSIKTGIKYNMSTKQSMFTVDKSIDRLIEKMRGSNYRKATIHNQQTSNYSNCTKHPDNEPGITVMTSTIRPEFMSNVLDNYNRQTYKKKELIIILNKNDMDINLWKDKSKCYPNVRIFQLDEEISLGECYNFCVKESTFDYIATFDDDDYYAPNYLFDIVKAFHISNADVVGKRARYIYFKNSGILAISGTRYENCYVDYIDGPTLSFHKRIFDRVQFTSIPCGIDVEFCKDCNAKDIKIYSTNRFNHVYIRHSSSHGHTWQVSDQALLMWGGCRIVGKVKNYQEYTVK